MMALVRLSARKVKGEASSGGKLYSFLWCINARIKKRRSLVRRFLISETGLIR